jgi:RHS repeat-associated protein
MFLRICFFFCFIAYLFADSCDDLIPSTSEEIASMQSTLIVEDYVSVLSGQLIIQETDLLVKGAQNIQKTRYYFPPHVLGRYHDKEKVNNFDLINDLSNQKPGLWKTGDFHLICGYNIHSPYLLVPCPNGIILSFEIKGDLGILRTSTIGCSNLIGDTPSSRADIRNTSLIIEKGNLKITFPDGLKRLYKKMPSCLGYFLDKEILPNGKIIRYSYNDRGLSKIHSTDRNEKYVYASISTKDQFYQGSDGRSVKYHYAKKEIKGKKKIDGRKVRTKTLFPILTKASNPYYQNTMHYNDRVQLDQYDGKNYPISCIYSSEKGKPSNIQTFSTPTSTIRFAYDHPVPNVKEGMTTVTYPNNKKVIYRFNKKLLLKAVENWFGNELINQKLYHYDTKQHIQRIELRDGKNLLLLAKNFECDQQGNPLVETREGDFGKFTIKRSYLQDRLIEEQYDDGLGYIYTYLDDTHLLTSKTITFWNKPIRRTIYTYDDACNLICKEEQGKTTTWYHLFQEGSLIHRVQCEEKVDCDGNLIHKTLFEYDRFGNVSKEKYYGSDGLFAYQIEKTYDSHGNLLNESNPVGQVASYKYDVRGRVIHEIPFHNQTCITNRYDAKGRLIHKQEEDHETYLSYDPRDLLIKKVDYLGQETTYSYHPVFDKPTLVISEPTSLRIEYDAFGREIKREDGVGAITKRKLNSNGEPLAIFHPDGGVSTYAYDTKGQLCEYKDPDGLVHSFEYDPLGRLLSEKIGSRITSYLYDSFQLIKKIDPMGYTTCYDYNPNGKKIAESREGRKKFYTYDSLGFLSQIQQGNRTISYQRDHLGRVIFKSIDDILQTKYSYDAFGNIESITNPHKTAYFYDKYNRLIKKIDPELHITTISYGEGDCILTKQITDPNGNQTIETFNAHGLLLKREISGALVEEYSYDAALRKIKQDHLFFSYSKEGHLLSMSEGINRRTVWTYTLGGKIQTKLNPDGTEIPYCYSNQGELIQMGSREFKYDDLGRLIGGTYFERKLDPFDNIIEEKWSNGLTIKSRYDDWNRPLERLLPDDSKILYSYEGPFLKKVTRRNNEGKQLFVHRLEEYDEAGRLLTEDGLFKIDYAYDCVGRRISQRSSYFSENCLYDNAGNLIQHNDRVFAYDAANQLIPQGLDERSYYDEKRNWIRQNEESIAVDEINQLMGFSYDHNGNFLGSGFVYDEFNQLIKTADCDCYIYDALGRRIQKGKTCFFYINNEEMGSYIGNEPKELKITALERPIALEINHRSYAVVTDVQGVIRKAIDCQAKEEKVNQCLSFGEQLSDVIPYAYLGKRYDPETQLVYFGKRYYDPKHHRWISPDPLGPIDHSNLYQYLFNNPFRYKDPDGQSIGGYLLGFGEIILGGALIASAGVLEIVTFGGYTVGFGVQVGTGAALITSGLALTTYHGKDLSLHGNTFDQKFDLTQYLRFDKRKRKNEEKNRYDEPGAPPYRGDELGDDPTKCPDEGFEWKGRGKIGSKKGRWYNKEKNQSLHPDIDHPPPQKPHWDYKGPEGEFRLNIDGTWEIKR